MLFCSIESRSAFEARVSFIFSSFVLCWHSVRRSLLEYVCRHKILLAKNTSRAFYMTKCNSCLYYDEKNFIRGLSSGFLIAVLKVEGALRQRNVQIHGGLPKLERWAVFTFPQSSRHSVKHRDYFTLRLNYFWPIFLSLGRRNAQIMW